MKKIAVIINNPTDFKMFKSFSKSMTDIEFIPILNKFSAFWHVFIGYIVPIWVDSNSEIAEALDFVRLRIRD